MPWTDSFAGGGIQILREYNGRQNNLLKSWETWLFGLEDFHLKRSENI